MKPGRFYWLPQPFLLAGSRTTTAARGPQHGVCGARARSRGRARANRASAILRAILIMWNKKSSFQRHWGRPIRISPAVGLLGAIRAARVVAIERCADLAEPLCAQLAPVRELVVSIPAPRCDHREHEDPTIAKQVLIGCRVVLTDFLGRMGDVELDMSAAACLEVYKEQPSLRPEQVARMRLAVQQLLAGTTPFDGAPQVSQSLAEKLPLCVRKLRSVGAVANQRLRLGDSIREVRRSHIDLPHAGMQPLQNLRILGWCDVTRR